MEQLRQLELLLDKHISVHNDLLELENNKTDVLIKGKTAELNSIIKQEQPLIMLTSNIEKQRMELQAQMGIDNDTLRQIIDKYKNESAELEEKYQKLTALIKSLKKVCEKNKKLLNTRLSVINHILSEVGYLKNDAVTYKSSKA